MITHEKRLFHRAVRAGLSCVLVFSAPLLFGTTTRARSQSSEKISVEIPVIFRPFSADQIHSVGKKTTTGKVYAIEKALRVEGEEKGKKSISIMRFDRKVMWVLMPDQKKYMEMGSPDTGELAALQEGTKTQRESLGTEQVGAYHCHKARVRVTYQGRQYTSIEWAAKELDGFVVKRADENGQWSTEYQNVRLGPQDRSLFEIPAGYQKLSMGGMRVPQP